MLAHGTGALNIDGCRVETDAPRPARGAHSDRPGADATSYDLGSGFALPDTTMGRWPANVVHDGSDEVLTAFPDSDGGGAISNRASPKTSGIYGEFRGEDERFSGYPDNGSAARFFYSAKADADDRMGSKHPTVKPVDLMRWLIRLVTPPGGLVLDPFAGTGSTGIAAIAEGVNAILIEREAEFVADIQRRLDHVAGKGGFSGSVKTRNKKPRGAVPLFGDEE